MSGYLSASSFRRRLLLRADNGSKWGRRGFLLNPEPLLTSALRRRRRSHKTPSRIPFCLMQAQCGRPRRASSSQPLNALLSVCVSVSLSIKPFSQQAYSVQTAGTTTISGEKGPRFNYLLSAARARWSYLSTGWFLTPSGRPGLLLSREEVTEKESVST